MYDHLQPCGVLVASITEFWKAGDSVDAEVALAAGTADPADGRTCRCWSRSTYDPTGQTESTQDRCEVLLGSQVVESEEHERSPATLRYTQLQARRLCEEAGFAGVRLNHEFTWAPARPEDSLFVVVGRKPIL